MTYIVDPRTELTAFNENLNTSAYPFIEGSFIYDLIPANFRTFTSGSGSVTASNRICNIALSTSSGDFAAIQSFRAVNHKVGNGVNARFSGYFATNVADSWQGIGLLSVGDEVSFGYNGTSFGIWHRYGGIPEVRTITVTGASGGSTDLTLTLNGTAYTIPLTSGTTSHNAYEISSWLNDNQTVWGADNIDNTVIINALSDGAKSGTYTYSHATSTGTIAQNKAGVAKTSDFVAQSSWNQNTFSTLDPSKGNIYEITYQDMGFGEINYSVIDPETGNFVVVHRIKQPNSGTELSIPNPSLRAGAYAVSLGSTTILNVYYHSVGVFSQAVQAKTRNPRSTSNTQTLSTTNPTNILAIRNRKTYNNYNNQIEIEPITLTFANESNKTVVVELRASQDFNVELIYSNLGTNLITDVSTTSATINSGRILGSYTVAPNSDKIVDLTSEEIRLPPSLNFAIVATRTGGSSGDFTASLTWYEDI
jgi:hypothetical protein